MGIFFAIVVGIGVVALAIVKNDEMSGLGRNVKAGTWRHAHGAVIKVTFQDEIIQADRAETFKRCFPAASCLVFLLAALFAGCAPLMGLADLGTTVSSIVGSGIAALAIGAEAMVRTGQDASKFSTFAWCTLGALVVSVLAWPFASACLAITQSLQLANALMVCASIPLAALGAAIVPVFKPQRVKVLREFEDGAKNTVTVSVKSVAFKAFSALAQD